MMMVSFNSVCIDVVQLVIINFLFPRGWIEGGVLIQYNISSSSVSTCIEIEHKFSNL